MKNRFLQGLFLVFLFNFSVLAQSKYAWKTASSSGYTYKYVSADPNKARFYTLANGLTVILSENPKEPRITALIPTRAGSNTDPRTHTGLAHYLEHMLFKGTDKIGTLDWAKEKPLLDEIDALYEKYNKTKDPEARKAIYKDIDAKSGEAAKFAIANEYDKLMANMGGQGTNAFTSFEQTVYTEDIPANGVDRFLKVQAERFRKPVLRIFHTELEAVYEEKNRGLDNDGRKVYETRNAALYPTHNYGQQTTIGTIEHLKNPSLVEIRNYFEKYYVPNNMAIIMSGDFKSDELIKKIDAAFKYMKAKPVKLYTAAPEKPLTSEIVREVYGPTPDNIVLAWRWPGVANPRDRVVGTIVDEMMSNASAGLIDLNLVKAQKVQRASSSPDWNKDYCTWSMSGTPKTGQTLNEVKDLLLGELEKLKKGDFDEDIIRAIAANFKLNEIQGLESSQARAYGMLSSFILSGGKDWASTLARTDAMAKVTKAEVMAFAKKYCGPGYVTVYKRKGTDADIQKVEKPAITPVEVNREAESAFVKEVNAMAMQPLEPQWLDFDKSLTKSKIGRMPLLYVQNKDNDLFRMSYRFEMGSWNSKMLPIAIEYLPLLATTDKTADQLSTAFYKLASKYSTAYQDRSITLSLTGLNENFEKTVELFEQMMTQGKADAAVFELLKTRILKQRADAKLNKGAILQGLTQYANYGSQNPFNSLQLSAEELNNLKAEDVLAFLKDLFNYQHSVLYYGPKSAGDLEKALAAHKISPTAKDNLPLIAKFDMKSPEKPAVYFADFDMVQAEINWSRPLEIYNPAEAAKAEVYNAYFGGGMGSIVFQTIRESKALAYSTYAHYYTPIHKDQKHRIGAYVGTQADKLHESIASMNELLNKFPEAEKNLANSLESLTKDYQTQRITQDGIIYTYLDSQAKGLSTDIRKDVYSQLPKVKLADLKAFQEEKFANKPFNLCIVASEGKIKTDELSRYGDLKKLSLKEIFGY